MTRSDDVAGMPEGPRSTAICLDNGEVMWPFGEADTAVNALADAGHVLLGVDARDPNNADAVEVPVSIYNPSGRDDVEQGRQAALAAILRAETLSGWSRPHLLLTWR